MIDYAFRFFKYLGLVQKVIKISKKMTIFKVHWKNDPNVPGMLQVESLVQMSALSILSMPGNKGKVVYLVSQ